MKELVRINNAEDILKLLLEFDDVFPHLKEKVDSYEEYALKLSKNACVYKAVLNGENVGILVFYANDKQTKTAYVSLIGIKTEFQGMKLGSWLINECEKIAKRNGMKYIKLEVDVDNHSAIEFYFYMNFVYMCEATDTSNYMIRYID